MNKVEEPNGLCGIINKGNTCYMNSAIQAFCSNRILCEYLFNNKIKICKTILSNAPRIFSDKKEYNISNDKSSIPIELRRKISNPGYDPNNLTDDEKNIIYNSTITIQLTKLLFRMWERNVIINPLCFTKIFLEARNNFFYGGAQHDAEEAYSCILQQMQEELAEDMVGRCINFRIRNPKVKEFIDFKCEILDRITNATSKEQENSLKKILALKKIEMPDEVIVSDAFGQMRKYYEKSFNSITFSFTGFIKSSIKCPLCPNSSNRFEPATHISLSIPKMMGPVNIYHCIREYCKEEILDENNLWECNACNSKVRATKSMQLWEPPKFLVIQLKRFDIVTNTKDNRLVAYPINNLNIAKYVSNLNYHSDKSYSYKLTCVINHIGNMHGGHYYSYAMNSVDKMWYSFDDVNVNRISSQSVVTANAYLLFYTIIDKPSDDQKILSNSNNQSSNNQSSNNQSSNNQPPIQNNSNNKKFI